MMLLLHETSGPHVHAGTSALSLVQVVAIVAVLFAGAVLLRRLRGMRVSRPATESQ